MSLSCTYRLAISTIAVVALLSSCVEPGDENQPVPLEPTNQPDPNQPNPGECDAPVTVSSAINSDQTWTSADGGCVEYVITQRVSLNAELTIEEGVTVEFMEEAGLRITGGLLTVEGTAANPVVFQGTEEGAGHWDGIFVEDNSNRPNSIQHAIIRGAGGRSFHGTVEAGAIVLGRNTHNGMISLQDTTIEQSAGFGVYLSRNGRLGEFANNVITDNHIPVSLRAHQLRWLDSGTTYMGNEVDAVEVRSGTVNAETTIPGIDVPYRAESFTIDAPTTIEAGATFHFQPDSRLTITGGPFIASGTDDDPILFSSVTDGISSFEYSGNWDGVFLYSTTDPENLFNHVTIEHGGRVTNDPAEAANLRVGRSNHPTRVSITNSTFRTGLGAGVYLHQATDLLEFAGNGLSGFESFAVSLHPRHIGAIDEDNSISSTPVNGFHVRNGNLNDDTIMGPSPYPFLLAGDLNTNGNNLTIEGGTEIAVIEPGVGITVDEGRLDILGSQEPVIMQTLPPTPGGWRGIYLLDTPSGETSTIRGLILRHAASSAWHGSTNPAGITVGRSLRPAWVDIQDSTFEDIQHSGTPAANGIFVHSESSSNANICTANEFTNVQGTDCVVN